MTDRADPREQRIIEAREKAQAAAPKREAERRSREVRFRVELDGLTADEAQELVTRAEKEPGAIFIGPVKMAHEWREAVAIGRRVAIHAARNETTITYGDIKLAVFRLLGVLVGYSMFSDLAAQVNRKADGVLLSAIIVKKDTGRPGDGFYGFALTQGYDAPLEELQKDVFEAAGRLEA